MELEMKWNGMEVEMEAKSRHDRSNYTDGDRPGDKPDDLPLRCFIACLFLLSIGTYVLYVVGTVYKGNP